MVTRVIIFFYLLSTLFSNQLFAQLSLPAIIDDHMVLQQETQAPLWGWYGVGKTVNITCSWSDQTYSTKADHSGRWEVAVETPSAGGPYSITILAGEKRVLKNIMIGEVWLCSGQSNMEMPLQGWANQPITGSEEAIASADYPNIRLFTVTRKTAYEPETDCSGSWMPCSPETAAGFSATGYFFGLDLYKKLKVPIGLIHSSWGGTPAEAWTSQEFIDQIPYFHTSEGACDPKAFRARKLEEYDGIQEEWLSKLGFGVPEISPEWTRIDFDATNWSQAQVPASWKDTEIGAFEGLVDFRLEFKAFGSWTKKEMILDLGPIDEMDNTWINGVLIGSHPNVMDWPTPRSYSIPAGVLKKGKNMLAVQVANTSGLGGINGEKKAVKIYPAGKKTIAKPLAGKWKYQKIKSFKDVAAIPWCNNCGEPHTPTTLYNGMIAPLIPFKIKGAIWYQGESNRYDGPLYEEIFTTMIENWRADWKQGDFPFYFVQIAPFSYNDDFNTGLLKEAQAKSMKLKNTGMVVTSDIGSLSTIHPPDKRSVGTRLAGWALAKDYGFKNLNFSGPLYRSYTIEEDQIRIHFNYICGGLKAKEGDLKHFMIAGSDSTFVPAKAKIENNSVVVYSEAVKQPVAVRFGWGHTDETNLFNMAGLPAGPFRTDSWKEK